MIHSLHSNFLDVNIRSVGAELCSVKNKQGIEFLWQGATEIWPRQAPVLFPIVGKLKEGWYSYNKKNYVLPQHGFARDAMFELSAQNKNSCNFTLHSNAQSKLNFPFDFELTIRYELQQQTLITTYTVHNTSLSQMYFSIGAHPGFNCPIHPHEQFEDYYLEFGKTHYELSSLDKGLRSGEKRALSLSQNRLPLNHTLFDNDALVFENHQINYLALCSVKSARKITMNCDNWPYFGIWSKKGKHPFICLEPWQGIADGIKDNQVLEQKTGIQCLEPQTTFECSFSIQFE